MKHANALSRPVGMRCQLPTTAANIFWVSYTLRWSECLLHAHYIKYLCCWIGVCCHSLLYPWISVICQFLSTCINNWTMRYSSCFSEPSNHFPVTMAIKLRRIYNKYINILWLNLNTNLLNLRPLLWCYLVGRKVLNYCSPHHVTHIWINNIPSFYREVKK